MMLARLTGNLCFWRLSQRRQPMSADPKRVPGAEQAEEALKSLRNGETIFGFLEAADAGLDDAKQSRIETPGGCVIPVTQRAAAFFGQHANNQNWTGPNTNGGW